MILIIKIILKFWRQINYSKKLKTNFSCSKLNLEMYFRKRSLSNDKDNIGEQNEVKINCNSIMPFSR